MARYAIGDLQGCYAGFEQLLNKLEFDQSKDELWLAGDLVNRGPDSLACLRLARQLSAKIVLGNHDLHLLACYYSKHLLKKKDSLQQVFDAPDCADLMDWLRRQPLLHVDDENKIAMCHAGIPHIWKVKDAKRYAAEVHAVLASDDMSRVKSYFTGMYGNKPASWSDDLTGQDRLRVITNYLTRMRFVDNNGVLELTAKEGLATAPNGCQPWFSYRTRRKWTIVFGHWAALEGVTHNPRYQAIDTGFVWGGELTALNLETFERVSVSA